MIFFPLIHATNISKSVCIPDLILPSVYFGIEKQFPPIARNFSLCSFCKYRQYFVWCSVVVNLALNTKQMDFWVKL